MTLEITVLEIAADTATNHAQRVVHRLFEAGRTSATRTPAGRNEPCSCGSARKYKKCQLTTDENADRGSR